MSSYLTQIDDILTALGDAATADEIANALQGYGRRDIQAVLAARASDAGGGGAALTVTGDTGEVADVAEIIVPGLVTEVSPGVASMGLALQVASLALTDAQIKAIPVSPFAADQVIVPAPGADKVLLYVSGYMVCDTTGGFYDYGPTANGKEAHVGIANTREAPAGLTQASARVTESSNVLGSLFQFEDVYGVALPPNGQVKELDAGVTSLNFQAPDGQELALIVNSALSITGANGDPDSAAPFTDGHASNTLTVHVVYAVLDLAA